jgi:TolB-like protein
MALIVSVSSAHASGYPASTEFLESTARHIVAELEKKAEFRYVGADRGDYFGPADAARKRPYLKIPWQAGDRESVAVYLFQERGTTSRSPFAELMEKELTLALDSSTKFMPVTRDEKFLAMHKKEIAPTIDERTAPAFGSALGARYFLTGTFWLEGGSTIVLCSLWDAELGVELNAQRLLSSWDPILLKERASKGWWKALLGLGVVLGVGLFFRLLNRSVCYNLRCRENKWAYAALQIIFALVILAVAGLAGLWWLGP